MTMGLNEMRMLGGRSDGGTQTDTRSSRAQPLRNQCCMKITLLPCCGAYREGDYSALQL